MKIPTSNNNTSCGLSCSWQEFKQMALEFHQAAPTLDLDGLDNAWKCLGLGYLGMHEEMWQNSAAMLLQMEMRTFIAREVELMNNDGFSVLNAYTDEYWRHGPEATSAPVLFPSRKLAEEYVAKQRREIRGMDDHECRVVPFDLDYYEKSQAQSDQWVACQQACAQERPVKQDISIEETTELVRQALVKGKKNRP